MDGELAEVSAEGIEAPELAEVHDPVKTEQEQPPQADQRTELAEQGPPPPARELGVQEWDGRLDLHPLPSRRVSPDDRLALLLLTNQNGRDGLADDESDGTPEVRSWEVGGYHIDIDLVDRVIRNGLRMQRDMGQDTVLEVGLIRPRTGRSAAGRNVTTVGMRLQLSPAWEVHAGYGAAFGSGMRAQVGLSRNW